MPVTALAYRGGGEKRVVEPHIETLLGEYVGELGEAGEGQAYVDNPPTKNTVTRVVVNGVVKR